MKNLKEAFPSAVEVIKSKRCLTYDDDKANIFFHCTPTKNVNSILKTGIIPGKGQTFDTEGHSTGKIFLSMGYEEAVQWQTMIAETTLEDTAILQIKLSKKQIDNLSLDLHAYGDGMTCSFYITEPIPPKHITVADTGFGTANFPEHLDEKQLLECLIKECIRSISR